MNDAIKQEVPPSQKTFKTSLSLPRTLHRRALKKCSDEKRAFSTYVQILVERDLAAKQAKP